MLRHARTNNIEGFRRGQRCHWRDRLLPDAVHGAPDPLNASTASLRLAEQSSLGDPLRETNMKPLIALAFVLMWLTLGVAMTACSDDSVGSDYYENDVHGGYPGPGTRTPGRDS